MAIEQMDRMQAENAEWVKEQFLPKEGRRCAEEIAELVEAEVLVASAALPREEFVEKVQRIIQAHYGPLLPFIGMVEEIGELGHALLKRHQGIRTSEDHDAAIKDAVADLDIYKFDFANREGFLVSAVLEQTWEQVRKRDWNRDPEKGGTGS